MAVIDGPCQGVAPACFAWRDKSKLPWEWESESGVAVGIGIDRSQASFKAHGPVVISDADTERVSDPDPEAQARPPTGLIQPGIRM
jgi:hypothetical protein